MLTAVVAYSVDLDPRAECNTCSWSVGPSSLTRDRAFNHCESRGHEVAIITESRAVYTPRKDSPPVTQ